MALPDRVQAHRIFGDLTATFADAEGQAARQRAQTVFLLQQESGLTLAEMAKIFGVTKQRVGIWVLAAPDRTPRPRLVPDAPATEGPRPKPEPTIAGPSIWPAATTIAPDGMLAAVYRGHDPTERLLYVGFSQDLAGRRFKHLRASTWTSMAARVSVDWYPTCAEARAAEVAAIASEAPLFNIHHADPEASARLVRYLVEADRYDLLAPAISRG